MHRIPIGVRPLAARDPGEPHRAATQLELFFDLIFVIAIASVTAAFHHAISAGHGGEKLVHYVVLFLAIWWAWVNFTWFASAFDNDDPLYRVLVMVIMLGALIFAGGASSIFETLDFSWGVVGWIVMRLGMVGLWLRAAAEPRYRRLALRYAGGVFFAQLCWTALYLAMAPGTGLFLAGMAVVFVIEWTVPLIAERAGPSPWHRHHIIERYGLLTIITLGEVMFSVGAGFGLLYGDHPDLATGATALSGFVIVFVLWWLYFLPDEHLPRISYRHVFAFGYVHVLFFMGCALTGAGIGAELDLTAHHSAIGQAEAARYLGLPLALAFLSLWVLRDRYHRLGHRQAALPAMALLMLGAAFTGQASWAFALLSVLTLIWRAPLRKRASHD